MKGFSKLFAAAVVSALCGCQLLDSNFFPNVSRVETQRSPRDSSGRVPLPVHVPPGQTPEIRTDTDIVCTAVRFPEGYDWRKDSTNGTSECEILLYRNGEIERIIKAGGGVDICSDPDMHHLIGMNVFTEYSTLTSTVITMDGEELVRFEGCEMLKGLVYKDGDLYTLSVGRDGQGFSFRKNGEVIMKRNSKVFVYGNLEDPSCPETGALYLDEGDRLVFCYRESDTDYVYHVVKDGNDQIVRPGQSSKILDMKVIRDSIVFAEQKSFGLLWSEAYVPFFSPGTVAGCVNGSSMVYDTDKELFTILCRHDAVIYCKEDVSAALCHPTRGNYSVYYSSGKGNLYEEPCYYFTRRCATFLGKELLVAVNPVDSSKKPYLSLGDRRYELDGLDNGYVSGIRVSFSQTTEVSLSHPTQP
ncbi:MAG: hypothetical protein MJY89_02835 [Bacteroidales bacterium]|nr:hypothetical protein [Bacteroidales bacterium]